MIRSAGRSDTSLRSTSTGTISSCRCKALLNRFLLRLGMSSLLALFRSSGGNSSWSSVVFFKCFINFGLAQKTLAPESTMATCSSPFSVTLILNKPSLFLSSVWADREPMQEAVSNCIVSSINCFFLEGPSISLIVAYLEQLFQCLLVPLHFLVSVFTVGTLLTFTCAVVVFVVAVDAVDGCVAGAACTVAVVVV